MNFNAFGGKRGFSERVHSLHNVYFGNLECSGTAEFSHVTTTSDIRNWSSQRWEITPLGGGEYKIKNMKSNLLLRALYTGGNWANGNYIGISYWENVNSIKWAFDYVDD